MPRLTPDEIRAMFEQDFPGLVHRQRRLPFGGTPGHFYFVPRQPTDHEMAQITHQSGDVEVACYRFNDAYILRLGGTGLATTTIVCPDTSLRDQGLEEYEWLVHTHPLEMQSSSESVAWGARDADYRALDRAHAWGQTSSVILVCQGGAVIRRSEFQMLAPAAPARRW